MLIQPQNMTDKTWHGCTANWTNLENADFWIIRDKDQKELARFPSNMNEQAVMAVVHTVRQLETATFEAGREFGGQAMMAAGRQKMQEQKNVIVNLDAHNTELANKLESLIGAKD